MKRRLFNLAAGLSLVLCIAIVAVWARSFASETILLESRRGQCLIIGVDWGPKAVHDYRENTTLESFLLDLSSPPATMNGVATPSPREHRFLGFLLVRGEMGKIYIPNTSNFWTPPFWIVGVPYWFLGLLAVALPARWLWRQRTMARRKRLNLCPACGYDMRATSGRCPECGEPAAP